MKILLGLFINAFSFSTFSGTPEVASSMVPRGKVVDTIGRDYKVKTMAGTKIEIEFKRNGLLEEARGMNLNKGDDLEPGEGLLSLSSVAHILQEKGKRPQGLWWLEKDEDMGWIYEFESVIVSAKDGKIIKKKIVPPSQ